MQDNQSSAKPQKKNVSPYQKGVSKALQESGYQQASQALSQGVPPQHIERQSGFAQESDIMTQLMSLSQTKMDDPGTAKGPFIALADLFRGKGFNPLAPQQTELGLDTAIKLLNLQIDSREAERRQASAGRKATGELAKSKNDLLKLAQNQAQITGDYQLLNALTQQVQGANQNEEDPAFDPAFRQEFQRQNLERTFANRKELDEYTRRITPVIDDVMRFQDIAEKLPDYKGGIFNQIIARGDTVAKAIAADPVVSRFNSRIDSSLGTLVKYGGDTGNLNEQEQQRAKKAIGDTHLPLAEKIQIYNDTLDKVFAQLDTRVEQAKEPGYSKRFPKIKAARERFEKNKKYLAEVRPQQKTTEKISIDNLFEGLE